ncbi:hypothetical protein NQ318_005754 [Aromia moschata]|uniref:Uncharacterized protein n=1 Tax=Aromia moschata TaxID=1265417 RepID=A0AAV8YTZ2_9CUCU|nr:hypothetical protein NQ318_005754 [Aromia moschata]
MAEGSTEAKPKLQIKHDWYQTEEAVVITVLVKNVKQEFLKVNISDASVNVDIRLPDFEDCDMCFNLAHQVIAEQSSYKLTPSKIEIKLKKTEGIRWDKLEGVPSTEAIKAIPQDPVPQLSGPPSYPTSKKGKDWSAVEKEITKQEQQEKPEGEEALNKLFQEIYGKGSDEVKRAMNKSYMESGGTVLKNPPRNLHISATNEAKLFFDHENSYAFEIISRDPPVSTISPDNKVKTTEEFNAALDQNWRASSASEIVKTFINVKDYCIENGIAVSDARFDKLVDGLMDHCETLTDTELADLLSCLCDYPPCQFYTSHNFHDIWSCLDDICCWKMIGWDTEKMFIYANLWYKLNLGKLCDYVFVLIDRLTRRADSLSKDQLYEYALEKQIENMNVDEMAVVAMGYFKTKTKIKLITVAQAMVKRVTENSKSVHEISLTAILKILRYSKQTKIVSDFLPMLDNLSEEIDRLSHLCCLHMALLGTGLHILHNKSLQRVSEKIVRDIADVEKVRLKDIERLLNVLTLFDFVPKTEPDLHQAALGALHAEEREKEYILYPKCLPSSLYYLSLRNIYSYDLMNKVLDKDYITETYGKTAKNIPQVLLSLDASIDIECPDYEGNRLPRESLRLKAAKWLTEFTPSYDQPKKITAADQLVLDTIDTVKAIVKDERFIYVDHVLPHFSRADIVLCKDKTTGSFVKPLGFEKYVLGDVMFPKRDDTLQWFAIVILGWNNTIRESSLPLGNMIMKQRQLEKMGYTPVFVIWNEFLRLSQEDKIEYMLRKLS